MTGVGRVTGLAVRFNWSSKSKFVLLATLVAIAMTVFLIVTELSNASSDNLDEAISTEVGETGSYLAEFQTGFGLGREQLAGRLARAVAPLSVRPPIVVDVLPATGPECPPREQLGPMPVLVVRDLRGAAVDVPFGHNPQLDSPICLGGQQVPSSAVYLPNDRERNAWGTGVVVDPSYERVAALASTGPLIHRFLIVTGLRADRRQQLIDALTAQFHDTAVRVGVDMDHELQLRRTDGGDRIRSASEGVQLVYRVIGWGVLILGALGLLVAELIVVRDRTWFFGLARAVGARSRHIAGLILADVVLVLLAGTALAVVIAVLAQPAASQFARDAFQTDIRLLRPSTIPQLVAAEFMVLALAGVYPAFKAVRQDPLDVLEPPSS